AGARCRSPAALSRAHSVKVIFAMGGIMGQVLGLGITHSPPLCYKGNLSRRIKLLLADPLLPGPLRSPANWHPTMRDQWGTDEGLSHSEQHRSDMSHHFCKIRAELDAVAPDL